MIPPPERSETPERREAPERREDRMDIEKAKEILLAEVYLEKASDPLCRAEAQGFLAGHSSRDAECEELKRKVAAYRGIAIEWAMEYGAITGSQTCTRIESEVDAEAAKLSEPTTNSTTD